MDNFRLPESVDEIDAVWLTEALRRGGSSAGWRVASVQKTAIGDGTGFVGDVTRLAVAYAGDSRGPRSLIVKLASRRPEMRALAIGIGMYEVEASFYAQLAASFPLRTPRCYFSALDVASGEYVLLLEDLGSLRPGDQTADCSLADAELAVDHLAKLHAAFWDTDLDSLDWLPRLDSSRRAGALMTQYPLSWTALTHNAADLLGRRTAIIGSTLVRELPTVPALIAQGPVTFLHGDYRLDNMFFDDADDSGGFVVIDWQACSAGRAGVDLSFFLAFSLSSESRRAWSDRLTSRYRNCLANAGVEYTREACDRDMRAAALVRFAVMARLMSSTNLRSADRGSVLVRTLLDRANAYFDDTDFSDILGL